MNFYYRYSILWVLSGMSCHLHLNCCPHLSYYHDWEAPEEGQWAQWSKSCDKNKDKDINPNLSINETHPFDSVPGRMLYASFPSYLLYPNGQVVRYDVVVLSLYNSIWSVLHCECQPCFLHISEILLLYHSCLFWLRF